MSSKSESAGIYFIVFFALLALTGLTIAVAFMDFGLWNTPIAITIAVVKAVLVILFFMHVLHSEYLVKIAIFAALLWLFLLFGLTLGDYGSRSWQDAHQGQSWIRDQEPFPADPGRGVH